MRSIIYADLQHIVFLCINRKMHNAVYFDTAYSNAYTAVYCNHIFLNCTIDHIAYPIFFNSMQAYFYHYTVLL